MTSSNACSSQAPCHKKLSDCFCDGGADNDDDDDDE